MPLIHVAQFKVPWKVLLSMKYHQRHGIFWPISFSIRVLL